ncbi:nickel/cobalt transporter [Zhengella sp. ZM62]|uniref:nickel/cobalt transporter n=1 Tax=Zhengella sedimenti TaxID=3390035 RepID=UPI0039750734
MKAAKIAILGVILATAAIASAQAQSSLGIGAAEQALPPSGLFPSLMHWINTQQQEFYRALTGALRAMRADPAAAWLLVGLSFAYGVFHAAGPGHGKAVISSYMLANEVALRRGVLLSFVSAMLQAVTAIIVVGAVFLFLRGTGIRQTDAVWSMEVASYALVTAFGAWLLFRKLRAFLPVQAPMLAAAGLANDHHHDHGPACTHDHHHHHHHQHGHEHGHHEHAPGEVCPSCGHAHMPDPGLLSTGRFGFSEAGAAVMAVGLRPCSGALIVLTFAFLNGLWWAGIASAFAMAVGTAITVSALATLAVTAKNVAVRLSGGGRLGTAIHHGVEIGGALLVLLLGLLLLTAALSA